MAGNIQWFRWHHGSVTDPKFKLVAHKSKQTLATVIAVWAFVLEQASASDDRGHFGDIDCESLDCLLGLDDGATAAILQSMQGRGLVEDGVVCAWDKRQPKRERIDENSSERSRAFRDRQRHATPESNDATPNSDDATPRNATQRRKTPRVEKSREDKKKNTPLPPEGAFEDFWAAYPRKEAKKDAQAAFAKIDVPVSVLLSAIEVQRRSESWTKASGQFIPLPASWIRGRRWEDLPGSAKSAVSLYDTLPQWCVDAGFTHIAEAENARCHIGNYQQFRNGKRIPQEVAA